MIFGDFKLKMHLNFNIEAAPTDIGITGCSCYLINSELIT